MIGATVRGAKSEVVRQVRAIRDAFIRGKEVHLTSCKEGFF